MKNSLIQFSIFLFLLCGSQLRAQNASMLENGGFEAGIEFNKPNQFQDFRHVPDWEDREICDIVNFCSPTGDPPCAGNSNPVVTWVEGPNELRSGYWLVNDQYLIQETVNNQFSDITPASGEGYAGIIRGSLIQQKLSDRIRFDKAYKLTMKIRLASGPMRGHNLFEANKGNTCREFDDIRRDVHNPYENAKLELFLSDEKLEYVSNPTNFSVGACPSQPLYNEIIEKTGADNFIKTASIDIDLNRFPAGEWHEVEFFLKADALMPEPNTNITDDHQPFKWLVFDLNHDLNTLVHPSGQTECNRPFVFIDDVSLEEAECWECRNNCTTKDGCMYPAIESVSGEDYNAPAECIQVQRIENVSHLEIEIFDYYDLSRPLKKIEMSNPPETFHWDHLDEGGNHIGYGIVWVLVKATNDCGVTFVAKKLPTHFGQGCPNNLNIPNPTERICCYEDLRIRNKFLEEDEEYIAKNVFIGPHVTIRTGTNLSFQATNSINISPDVVIEQGAVVEAFIEHCTYEETRKNKLVKKEENLVHNHTSEQLFSDLLKTTFTIFPNPSHGKFQLELKQPIETSPYQIEVSNLTGEVIYQRFSYLSSVNNFDLSNIPSGTYFITLSNENEILGTQKIIIL